MFHAGTHYFYNMTDDMVSCDAEFIGTAFALADERHNEKRLIGVGMVAPVYYAPIAGVEHCFENPPGFAIRVSF